jgi:hypothetical protein
MERASRLWVVDGIGSDQQVVRAGDLGWVLIRERAARWGSLRLADSTGRLNSNYPVSVDRSGLVSWVCISGNAVIAR